MTVKIVNTAIIKEIVSEANGHLMDCYNIHASYFESVAHYMLDMYDGDISSEDAQQDIVDFKSHHNITAGFVEVFKCSWTADDVICIPEQDIRTHRDIIDSVDSKYLNEFNSDSTLLYVSEHNVPALKAVIEQYFTAQPFSKSPYSASCYNSEDIGWGHKPHGSVRISDHWNFETTRDKLGTDGMYYEHTEIHCVTNSPLPEDLLAVAVYSSHSGNYNVVFQDDWDYRKVPVKIHEDRIEIMEY